MMSQPTTVRWLLGSVLLIILGVGAGSQPCFSSLNHSIMNCKGADSPLWDSFEQHYEYTSNANRRMTPALATGAADGSGGEADTIPVSVRKVTEEREEEHRSKSPTGAILRSIVFPGWGQLYNESYLKAALFAGSSLTIGTILVWNHSRYSDALARYTALDSADVMRERVFREKEFYRDQRDVAGLWLLGAYVLAAVDAYVGAHLYDFDVSDSGVVVLPYMDRIGLGLSASYRF